MKNTLTSLAAVVSFLGLSCSALAAPTVRFQGEVTDQTCSVSINGETNSVVLLPTVTTTALNTAHSAGLTPFTITLTGCAKTDADKNISANFLGYNVITKSGTLGNTLPAGADVATNVSIQLLPDGSSNNNPVLLSGVTPVPGLVLLKDETSATHSFGAQYYTDGGATAGKITAVAEYTLSYQ